MTTSSWMPSLNEDLPGEIKTMMREYAEVAVEAYRRSLKPAAYMNDELPYSVLSLVPWTGKHNIPLYRLDDQP